MQKVTLRRPAQEVIEAYFSLPLLNIRTPYFNNRIFRARAGLPVQGGKGTPHEIADEAIEYATREHCSLLELSPEDRRAFLIAHNLGVDCSGFVFHVLNAEHDNKLLSLLSSKHKNWLARLRAWLRPVQNIGVKEFTHKDNSAEVTLADVRVGDFFSFINQPYPLYTSDHVILFESVEYGNTAHTIHYVHSIKRITHTNEDDGIARGSITITDTQKPLEEQDWHEGTLQGFDTLFPFGRKATYTGIRRLRAPTGL